MTAPDGYRDGTALWSAVTALARSTSATTGVDRGAVIRRFVFSRFLARVFHDPTRPWVLKGGTAVLTRVDDARTTEDIDLLGQDDNLDATVSALRSAAAVDLADHFRFVITKVETATGGAAQPGIDGCRVAVDAYVGATKKSSFGVDLVTHSHMTADPDLMSDQVLPLRGLSAPLIRLYPVVDHIADKLCAIQARYGTDGDQPSSRVKDLVDLVVFARTQDIDGAGLSKAIHGEWTYRGLTGSPRFQPPDHWERLYPPLARKVPACAQFTTFTAATAFVGGFIVPALDKTANGQMWSANDLSWLRRMAL